jgi:hypothetical protein
LDGAKSQAPTKQQKRYLASQTNRHTVEFSKNRHHTTSRSSTGKVLLRCHRAGTVRIVQTSRVVAW